MTASRSATSAFTLVELMVSSVILVMIAGMVASMTSQTANSWRYTTGKIEQFSGARDAFESLTTHLSQATLNTYYDYFDASGQPRTVTNATTFVPKTYGRQSELRFICGSTDRDNLYAGSSAAALAPDASRPRPTHSVFFHAPLGFASDHTKHGALNSLLNCWGYYIEFGSDQTDRPSFIQGMTNSPPTRYRYRLMQYMQPTESMATYSNPAQWLDPVVNQGVVNSHVLAENIVALILQPMLSARDEQMLTSPPSVPGTALAPSYFYDSTTKNPDPALNPKHQLPPVIRVTIVAIDEPSAVRLARGSTQPNLQLDGLFVTDKLQSALNYDKDLKTLQTTLTQQHCSFRVFTTDVIIRGAKWSKE
ncbi:MAG TPA: Verru_Chthon cassette protein C [Chthoniobacter sp.]|nr:Verru_Chthon cassette protein C [Chthoniobacter sp.]